MSKSKADTRDITCPSAHPGEGSVVFGVVIKTETDRRVGYLNEAKPATPETLALAGPVRPTEVFRIAAPCATHACKHYDGKDCTLARRIVQRLEPVVSGLPPCRIRSTCRWFHQEGKNACLRCPQVITDRHDASDVEIEVADLPMTPPAL